MNAPDKTLRADARRNRDNLLIAAAELFAEEGTTVSLEAVAKRAGVGIGTLYRHFPTREALVVAAYQSEVEHLCQAADELLASREPDEALDAWMERFVSYVATKRGMSEALGQVAASGSTVPTAAREQIGEALGRLLAAGQAAGTIRSDLDADDLLRAMSSIWAMSDTPGWAEQAHRLRRLLMDGLRHGAS
jgi:AcrR family transcriptional regulator